MSFSEARIGELRARLGKLGASAAYVRDTANIEWLTAFRNVFDDEQAHALMVASDEGVWNGKVHLHTDSRYVCACERESQGTPIVVNAQNMKFSDWAASEWKSLREWQSETSSEKDDGIWEPEECEETAKLAIESSISLSEYRSLQTAFKGQGDAFIETDGLVLSLRAVKDSSEVRRMKATQALTDAAFDHIIDFIKPGMTERDVQLELDSFMLHNGAEDLAFTTIIASGANGASPHAIVSDKVLEAGECVVMDFGAKWAGYCSDMTRTVFLGEPEGEMVRAWETMRLANESVEAMLAPGVTGAEAHNLALKILAEGGFEGRMGHGLGHGVGIEIHEEPVLSPRNETPLVEGNVVTVEPGIYIPGKFGMRLEDFGVITASGFDVFTKSTHEMVVL